jgi:hypothetical protein
VTQSPVPRAPFARARVPPIRRPEPAPGRASAPPAWAEPLFAFIERVDRRYLRIRPIRREGVSGISFKHHHGPDERLRDGIVVRNGDLVGHIHFDNRRIAAGIARGLPWLTRQARLDGIALARWASRQSPERRPVAYYGATILWPLLARWGAEVRDREQTNRVKWEDWYLRGTLRRWAPDGMRRLELGRGDLRTRDCWMSAAELDRRYGPERVATAS